MIRRLVSLCAAGAMLAGWPASAKIFTTPGWYLMIGDGTDSDPKKPIKGPYLKRAECLVELEEWVEMTDGTEVLDCNYLHDSPQSDTLSRG